LNQNKDWRFLRSPSAFGRQGSHSESGLSTDVGFIGLNRPGKRVFASIASRIR
jgi:hypothetical protein